MTRHEAIERVRRVVSQIPDEPVSVIVREVLAELDATTAEVARLRRIQEAAGRLIEAFDARDSVGAEWRDLRDALANKESK